MNLLSINNYHYRRAGSDAVFLDHDRLFQNRGWATAVFCMQHQKNLDSPWKSYFVDEIDLEGQASLVTRAWQATKVLYSLEARKKLSRLLDDFQPDVVHIHSIYHHISPSIVPLVGRLGVPVVLTAHDYKLMCPAYKMFDGESVCEDCRSGSLRPLIRKRCLHGSTRVSSLVAIESALHRHLDYYDRYIDRIICPSRFLLEKFLEWGWSSQRLVHVPNFFDSGIWSPNFAPGRFVLYFGRLAPEKGLETLLQACAESNVPLKIIGWGSQESHLRQLAHDIGAPAEFIPRLSASDLVIQIQAARAVVVPSEWYENASLAILESFACGKPVIASQIGGNPELVSEGIEGWLFKPGDSNGLSACLRQVWEMPDTDIESFGRSARHRAEIRHGSDLYFANMARLYDDLAIRPPQSIAPDLRRAQEYAPEPRD